MEYQFRNAVKNAKKAAMGEMFNLAKANLQPGDRLINFASGHPSEDIFQDKLIRKYIAAAMQETDKSLFQYGSHAGYLPLRETLAAFINQRGSTIKDQDELIVTYGATEAIFLVGQAMINPGDRVIVEGPSYVNAIKAFQLMGAAVAGVPMEQDGVCLEKLEKAMKQGAKFFYTVPNFGNPSGITMSVSKRKEVYDLAAKYQVLILEDNTYGELRYRGTRLPDIKVFDEEGVVVHVGSMSKMIAPALRVGYMVANKEFIKKIIAIKAVNSNGVSNIMQYALWKMFQENDMYRLVRNICDINAKKLTVTQESMAAYFPESIRHSFPDGGMYIWVTLPEKSDVQEFCRRSAIELHIPITPGNGFCVTKPDQCTSMRINFVKESMEDIAYGIEKVGDLMKCYRF